MRRGRTPIPIRTQFSRHIEVTNTCWLWTAAKNKRGYGVMHERLSMGKQRQSYAHRVSYRLFYGSLPDAPRLPQHDAIVVHHTCHNPSCVNPAHLKLITTSENSDGGWVLDNRAKTHCPKGHAYTPDNIKVRKLKNGRTGRNCRECNRIKCMAYYYAKHGVSA